MTELRCFWYSIKTRHISRMEEQAWSPPARALPQFGLDKQYYNTIDQQGSDGSSGKRTRHTHALIWASREHGITWSILITPPSRRVLSSRFWRWFGGRLRVSGSTLGARTGDHQQREGTQQVPQQTLLQQLQVLSGKIWAPLQSYFHLFNHAPLQSYFHLFNYAPLQSYYYIWTDWRFFQEMLDSHSNFGGGNLIINYIPPNLTEEELLTLFQVRTLHNTHRYIVQHSSVFPEPVSWH